MSSFFYNIIISPIELLIELLFSFFYKAFDNLGISIVAISLLVSLLSLPLYHIAEQIQKKERDQRKQMEPGIRRIKETFSGDEQYMILSTFYRQNHYHPAYALRSSVSLLIQVPFFLAAYHFLSHLPHLQGQSFAIIQNLGQPDHLLQIGSLSVNILPLLMTLINVFAGMIYTKGFPLRDKVQLYGMAGVFLVLLYQSPAGLVFYWTMNNVVSLIKNIFYKLKNPLKILYLMAVAGSVGLTLVIIITKPNLPVSKHLILIIGSLIVCFIPLILIFIKKIQNTFLATFSLNSKEVFRITSLSCISLWLLYGVVVIGNLISSSPNEFSFTGDVDNPLSYIMLTSTVFFGVWVVWPLFMYGMASKKMRSLMSFSFFILSATSVGNIFLFSGQYGHISKILMFDNPSLLTPNLFLTLVPLLFCGIVALTGLFLIKRNQVKILSALLTILVLATVMSGGYSLWQITKSFENHKQLIQNNKSFTNHDEIKPMISLSQDKQNVVILFLDRAISSYLPLVVEQFPQLKEQFAGFIYYPNTVSYGAYTLTAAPALMGGYEYTPDAINARDSEKLVDKHNEATLVLPRLFSEAGYAVTVFDPPFANYQWSDDFSAFKDYPEINVYRMLGRYSLQYKTEYSENLDWDVGFESEIIQNRLPMYAIFKNSFPFLRSMLYDQGTYFLMAKNPQVTDAFIDSYAVLHYLPQITSIDSNKPTFTFLTNDATHEPTFLQAPNYIPVSEVTDTSNPLQQDAGYDEIDQIHYHANAAALLQIGNWLDYLRKQGVYDNTKIIIVADHGRDVSTPVFKNYSSEYSKILGYYNPLMLIKEFNARGLLTEDSQFMTNADVPVIAIQNTSVSSINPFTKNDILMMIDKTNVNSFFSSADPKHNSGKEFVFDYSQSFSIRESIFSESNWVPILQP